VNTPNSTPGDLAGLGTPGGIATGAAPSDMFISALYTGLPAGTVYYSHNHLGSGALVTDANGNEIFRITYTEYGEIDLAHSGKYNPATKKIEHHLDAALIAITAAKYTGQEYDPETGFYYYNARYYDPQLGVFTTPDTNFDAGAGAFGFNRHMYVAGNPIMYSDPTGHNVFDDIGNWWDKNIGNPIRKEIGDKAFNVVAGLASGLVPGLDMYQSYKAGGWENVALGQFSKGATGALNMTGCVGCSVNFSHTDKDGWGFDFGIGLGLNDTRFISIGAMYKERGAYEGWNTTVFIGDIWKNGMNAGLGIIWGQRGLSASFTAGYGNEFMTTGVRATAYYDQKTRQGDYFFDGYSAVQYMAIQNLQTSSEGNGRETGTSFGSTGDPMTFGFENGGWLMGEEGLVGILGQLAGLKPTSVAHDNEAVLLNLRASDWKRGDFRFYTSMVSSFPSAQLRANMEYSRIVGYNRFRRGL